MHFIQLIFFIAYLSILGALIVLFLRQKESYFQGVKRLFFCPFLVFVTMGLLDLTKNLVRTGSVVFFITMGNVSAILWAAIVVGILASILVERPREKDSLKGLCSKWFFSKNLNFPLFIYAGYAVIMLILTWVFTPWRVQLVRTVWGELIYAPVFEWWYLVCLLVLLIAFVSYPCLLFIISSRNYKEKGVAQALRWLGVCWAGIGFSVFLSNAFLRALGFEIVEVGYALDILFFGIIAYFFKNTTVLAGFFETVYPSIQVGEGEHIVALYTAKADKMDVFSTYIHEGLHNGDKVIYVFPDAEDGQVERVLKEKRVDAKEHLKDGSLTLLSTSEWYPNDVYDLEVVNKKVLREIENAKERGYENLRTLIDHGDVHQIFNDTKPFFAELRKATGKVAQPNFIAFRAFNVETLREEEVLWLEGHGARSLFMSENFSIERLGAFSRRLGRWHEELVGKKILFEFDATSNYEEVVEDFVFESRSYGELVAVFTRRGGGFQSALTRQRGIRLFYLTAQTSVPTAGAFDNEILLPLNNTSLLLEALNQMAYMNPDGNVSIVFDSISGLILSIGFEKTYSFMCYALEVLTSDRITALFLLNPHAHDPNVVSSLRGLFNNQLVYNAHEMRAVKIAGGIRNENKIQKK